MTADDSPTTPNPPSEGEEESRDWFAPPPGQPDDITYSGPLPSLRPPPPPLPRRRRMPPALTPPREDTRVWPPTPVPVHDDGSTQPFPIVIEPRTRDPRVQGPRVEEPAPPPPAPPVPPPPPPPPPSEEPPDAAPMRMQAPPEAPRMEKGRQPRRGPRLALQGLGALVAVILGAGMPTMVGYHVYAAGRPEDQIQTVQPGKAGAYQHVAWRISVQRSTDPKCRSTDPVRVCLKLLILRAALDKEGAMRHGSPDVTTQDDAGRTWKALLDEDETPPDTKDNVVGHSYRMEFYSMVPAAVADDVDVLIRPSTYRSVPDQNFDDFLKDLEKSTEKNDHVLRFLREPDTR